MSTEFLEHINKGYTFKGETIRIGSAMLNGQVVKGAEVHAALKTLNRHGLIAGATGTGKTKTLQGMAESLSNAGVPTLVMDMKGDLSGLAAPGNPHPKIDERAGLLDLKWNPTAFPCEFLSLSDEPGVKLRATISEFGPVLLSKVLELNETQGGVISIIFKYADDNNLPLLDIKDLRKMLQFVSNEGKEEIEKEYGLVSTSSVGAIMRNLLEIEQQGAERFFGEISFEVEDLLRKDDNGKGYISILRLTDMQGKPRLFSTFMLCMLAEVYATLPEKGDAAKPELVIFIDEAHLIFKEASKALLEQLDTIVKLIRSKGVGLFFVTQDPTDIPDNILSQLGLKVQHALRAFTEKDRKAIKATSENYPISTFYKTNELITQLGIGEAFVTLLNEKGIPTPLAHTMLCAPESRMDILQPIELNNCVEKSKIAKRYNQEVDSESAYEILEKKTKKTQRSS
jgi:DNA helicase HerA-like ATPase